MPLIKMATAARRARVGSINTIRRALLAAGVQVVTVSPGAYAVEEADLNRFLQRRENESPAPPPRKPRRLPANAPDAPQPSAAKPAPRKRRQ